MGVDYKVCNVCGETFPDCGDFESCECGKCWCSLECAEADGLQEEKDGFTPDGSKWEQETSCDFCRKDDFNDLTLLEFALEKLNLSRSELIELYKSK